MPLFGTLKSMPLTDLLQWLCTAQVTGTLEVERERVSKRIQLKDGLVVGCSSDDPPHRLGHFLLSRGKITEEDLREALHRQERTGRHLGSLLVELEALSPDDLAEHLEAQAEETIYSLFDWDDAVFRFQEGEHDPSTVFPVSLRVEDVLLRGLKRYDEMREVRAVFHDPGIVLERTGKKPPEALARNRMGSTLWEWIDGERTVAEILLHVHGSEYVVTKFLYELHRAGLVRVARVKPISRARNARAAAPVAVAGPLAEAAETFGVPGAPAEDLLAGVEPASIDRPTDGKVRPPVVPAREHELEPHTGSPVDRAMDLARSLVRESRFEDALDVLRPLSKEPSSEESLRRLHAEAEAGFVEKAYRHFLPPSKVLHLTRKADELTSEDLSPSEFYLLSRIDGTWDIKSIILIAPLREVDALRTLKRMRENGLIELRDPPA